MTVQDQNILCEALRQQVVRVSEIASLYRSVPMGFLAAGMMERSINEARRALDESDTDAMIRSYDDLKGYEA